jgi:hypothetical protein
MQSTGSVALASGLSMEKFCNFQYHNGMDFVRRFLNAQALQALARASMLEGRARFQAGFIHALAVTAPAHGQDPVAHAAELLQRYVDWHVLGHPVMYVPHRSTHAILNACCRSSASTGLKLRWSLGALRIQMTMQDALVALSTAAFQPDTGIVVTEEEISAEHSIAHLVHYGLATVSANAAGSYMIEAREPLVQLAVMHVAQVNKWDLPGVFADLLSKIAPRDVGKGMPARRTAATVAATTGVSRETVRVPGIVVALPGDRRASDCGPGAVRQDLS